MVLRSGLWLVKMAQVNLMSGKWFTHYKDQKGGVGNDIQTLPQITAVTMSNPK